LEESEERRGAVLFSVTSGHRSRGGDEGLKRDSSREYRMKEEIYHDIKGQKVHELSCQSTISPLKIILPSDHHTSMLNHTSI
jgi:hypothetical protein